MYVSMSELSLMLLYSVLLGFFLGASYDIIRLTRIGAGIKYGVKDTKKYNFREYALIGHFFKAEEKKPSRKKDSLLSILVFFGDVIFCLFSSVSIAIFIYYFNNGEFRGFVLFGAAFGFFIYYFTLGRLVIYISERIVFALKLLLLYTLFFVLYPFYFLFGKISRFVYIIIQKNFLIIRKLYDIIYIDFYTKKRKRDIMRLASFGFLKDK